MSAGAKYNKEAEKGASVGREEGPNFLKGGHWSSHWGYNIATQTWRSEGGSLGEIDVQAQETVQKLWGSIEAGMLTSTQEASVSGKERQKSWHWSQR